ncbi:MAG: hypothetical protein LLG04_07265 [Parachlamydia sp.]|nr:hypothetical protein [Parachlamydia sp.]
MNDFQNERKLLEYVIRKADELKPDPNIDWKALVTDENGKVSEEHWLYISDPAKDKALDTRRQVGKSTSSAVLLYKTAYETPNCKCLFLALTRDSAKTILWQTLKETAQRLPFSISVNESDLIVTLPNKSQIRLFGADQKNFIERLRGITNLKIVIVDECGSFDQDHVQYLLDSVLQPAGIKLNCGKCIIGTPPPLWSETDLFYRASHGLHPAYKSFTITTNPFITNFEEKIEAIRIKNGWSPDNPTYLREYKGKWIKDIETLVFRFSKSTNIYSKLPQYQWEYVLGVDIGYSPDPTAIVVLAFSAYEKKVYVLEAEEKGELIPSALAEWVKEFVIKYHPMAIVGDTGGLGKAIIEELNQRHALYIKPAEKKNKREYVELINSDFLEGKVLLDSHLIGLITELQKIQWTADRKEFDKRIHTHRADALLYGWRECLHYLSNPKETKPSPHSTDSKVISQAYRDELRAQAEREKQEQRDLYGSDDEDYFS